MTRSHMKLDGPTARGLSDAVYRIKTVQAQIKQSPTDGSGRFVALVSTFGPPPDVDNDIISPGAFDDTITNAYIRHPNALWPVLWMHEVREPAANIGLITAAASTPQGLVVEGKLALDSNEVAMMIYQAMLEDRIREWSISYGIVEQHLGEWQGKTTNYLDKLELLEISAVTTGANRFTRTLSIKNDSTSSATNATVSWTNTPALRPTKDPVLARYNAQLDDLLTRKTYTGPTVDVDAFVLEVQQEMIRESLDRAEQAAWEERKLTMVLDPVPVRVEARMRPDR